MTHRVRLTGVVLLCLLVSASLAAAHTVSGKVVDSAGQPVTGASVWISQERAARTMETDASGKFSFSDVDIGPIELVARKEGLALGGIDARVVGSAQVNITLGESDSLPVKVVNQAFEPLAGARIKSMFVGGRFHVSVEDLTALGFPSIRSGDNGLLLLEELPKGSYVSFIVAHRNYAENRFPPVPAKSKELPVILYPGVTLRGRVTSPDQQPLHRARVSLFRLGVQGQREFAECLTDPEGFYNATVPPGNYYAAVRHAAFASPDPKPITLVGPEENTLDLQLLTPHLVRGSVVGPDGKPMGAVSIAYIAGTSIREESYTAADGAFQLRVPGGDGKVRVLPPDGFIAEIPIGIPLTIKDEPEARLAPFKLKALPEITGTVLNADGKPEPHVLISSLDLDPPCWTLTDANGGFQIRLARVPYEHTASFRAEHGRRFLRGDFTITFDKLQPVTVKLKKFDPDLSSASTEHLSNDLGALVNKPAPEIACKVWFNSGPLAFKDLRGKVAVLTLWGGFDTKGLGRNRIAELCALYELFRGVDDVVFIAVHDAGQEPDEVKGYVEKYGIKFPVGVDADPFVTFDLYDTSFIPQTVLIDKQGILRHYDVTGRLLELIKSLRRGA